MEAISRLIRGRRAAQVARTTLSGTQATRAWGRLRRAVDQGILRELYRLDRRLVCGDSISRRAGADVRWEQRRRQAILRIAGGGRRQERHATNRFLAAAVH